MGKKCLIKDILYYINNKLEIKNITIKEFTSILYLIDWEYCWDNNLTLFSYKWTNSIEDNIKFIINDLEINCEIESFIKYRYLSLKTPNKEEINKLNNYLEKIINRVLEKEFILNKSTYYFHQTLTFDLFYKMDKNEIEQFEIEKLIEMKKNKEY